MLLIRREENRLLANISRLEREFFYDRLSNFSLNFSDQQNIDLPEEILLIILEYLGKMTARLNIKYYTMWVKTKGMRTTSRQLFDKKFDFSLSKYIKCVDIDTIITSLDDSHTNDPGYDDDMENVLRKTSVLNLCLDNFLNLETISIGSHCHEKYIDIIKILSESYCDMIKCVNTINVLCDCEDFLDCGLWSESNTDLLLGIDPDLTDKITLMGTEISIRYNDKNIEKLFTWQYGFKTDIKWLRDAYIDRAKDNDYNGLKAIMFYHPLDFWYYNDVLKPLFVEESIELEIVIVGSIKKPLDYNPIY